MKTTPSSVLALRIIFIGWFCTGVGSLQAQLTDIATDATDPLNMDDTEPSIAVNPFDPLEIAVVTFSGGWSATQGAPVWKSTDGGVTWTKRFILPSPIAIPSGPNDQKIQFDQNGNLVIAELDVGNDPACLIFRQTGTDAAPLTPGAFYGDDQPMLDIDRNRTGTFFGRAYSAWLDVNGGNDQSHVERTTDMGITVNDATAGNGGFENRTTRSAVGTDGSVYIVFKTREGGAGGDFENVHFIVKRSDDGGVNWNALGANGVSVHGAGQMQSWFDNEWGNLAKGDVGRARSSDAWIATDPGDNDLYVVFCDRDASGFGQVFVTRSTDRGVTWSAGVRITDGARHSAYPEIAVACNGSVGVMYIDYDDSGTNTIFRHRFVRSFDNGVTWNAETLQSMGPVPANASGGFLWGDYEGLTAQGGLFYGVFTGASIGRTTSQLDPIFYRRQAWQALIAITCPTNIITNADPGLCSAVVIYPAPTVTGDLCTVQSISQIAGLPSGVSFPVGVTTNIYRVTDAVNASTSCQFTVTVNDNQPPTIACPPNVTVSCEASTLPAAVGSPTATDNCSFTLTFVDVIVQGSCTHAFTINRTWTVRDVQNTTRTCLHVIKVEDKKPPVVTCPANITVTCDTTVAKTGLATATDNCDPSVNISRRDVHISGDCDWFCITERHWTGTDDCGNTGKCIQTITKNTAPIIETVLPVTLGMSRSTVTVPTGRADCIIKFFPYVGSTPSGLKFDNFTVGADCLPGTNPVDGAGHLKNALLGEALKLTLFVKLKPTLGTTKLSTFTTCPLQPIIKQALAPDPDVNELLRVTNTGLGNVAVIMTNPTHAKFLLDLLKCINGTRSVCNP